jgi:predicted methyltransferase
MANPPRNRGLIRNALGLSHQYAQAAIQPGDRVVDATCGNGGDTVFLAELVGPPGQVEAFDIQATAIEKTRERLRAVNLLDRCSLHQVSHDQMATLVEPGVSAVLFNLGYLPGGDHQIGTRAETTLVAIHQALELVRPGGIVMICLYYGGDSGFAEHDAVLAFIRNIPVREFAVQKIEMANATNCPPIFICCERLSGLRSRQ